MLILTLGGVLPLSMLPSMRKVGACRPCGTRECTSQTVLACAAACTIQPPTRPPPGPAWPSRPAAAPARSLQLEVVGAAGSLVVFALAIIIMVKSCSNGLPELGASFPVWGFGSLGAQGALTEVPRGRSSLGVHSTGRWAGPVAAQAAGCLACTVAPRAHPPPAPRFPAI